MDTGLVWRILGAACLLVLLQEWLDRPRPERTNITIEMSEPEFVRDSILGSAYIEFRTANRPRGGRAEPCSETPQVVVERLAGDTWLPMQSVRRHCAKQQYDGSLDRSVTWHTRLRVPGRYRISVVYMLQYRGRLIPGPTFTVR